MLTYEYSHFREQNEQYEDGIWGSSEKITLAGRDFVRFVISGTAIYIDPMTPYWFVPSAETDWMIRNLRHIKCDVSSLEGPEGIDAGIARLLSLRSFLSAVRGPEARHYSGRTVRTVEKLNEMWLHITDDCNLKCRHCLFSGNQGKGRRLSLSSIKEFMAQTIPLGLNVVMLTGGEPLIHPEFINIVNLLMGYENIRVAILTNGLLYERHSALLRKLDRSRITFQVSLDGNETSHDSIRGRGSHAQVRSSISGIVADGFGCSLAMSVNPHTAHAMKDLVVDSAALGVRNVHFLWHFRRGHGKLLDVSDMATLTKHLVEAMDAADASGISIDNVEAIRSQVFTHIGTRFDLSSAGWDTLTIAPDHKVYPSPASVGVHALCAGDSRDGIENLLRNSGVLRKIRSLSVNDIPGISEDPLRFVTGGGDIDHCFKGSLDGPGDLTFGDDPYRRIYGEIVLRLIHREAVQFASGGNSSLLLRMGDIVYDCNNHPDVNFTHSNCLLSLATTGAHKLAGEFYGARAENPDDSILNPIAVDQSISEIVPDFALNRRYGCGSPVSKANLSAGQTLVDLGCGTGVELFMAAEALGNSGRGVGIDMTAGMIELAKEASGHVHEKLGFNNIHFAVGHLEDIPLPRGFADVVISNCVVNLSVNKRKVFSEMLRILKPGGRLLISDVVCETEAPLEIRTDPKLSGECLGGALRQDYLFSMLRDIGFTDSFMINRFPYRDVGGHQFFSLTFQATKPGIPAKARVMNPGPFEVFRPDQHSGRVIAKGDVLELEMGSTMDETSPGTGGLSFLDPSTGRVLGKDDSEDCGCCGVLEYRPTPHDHDYHPYGCMICGSELLYDQASNLMECTICKRVVESVAKCEQGHFVCDECHRSDPLKSLSRLCHESVETDMIGLLKKIRRSCNFPVNGPEHHSLAPAIVLTCFRNLGGGVTQADISEGIRRGKVCIGGSCASLGICGAAMGVGIAFSIILGANPLTPVERQSSMLVVAAAANDICSYQAARCCQREVYLSLKQASKLSTMLTGLHIPAEHGMFCSQHHIQKECLKQNCPLYPKKDRKQHE